MKKNLITACLCLLATTLLSPASPSFTVTYEMPEKAPHFTPRVYVILSQGPGDPIDNIDNWFKLPIVCAVDDFQKTGHMTIDSTSLSNIDFGELEGEYIAQAIVRLNPDWPVPGRGAGDLVSEPRKIAIEKGSPAKFDFHADEAISAPKFRKKGRIQDHYFRSAKLSLFHKRDYQMRYSIILPKNWDAKKKYPVIVYVIGFGAAHQQVTTRVNRMIARPCKNAIVVIPDANCRWGHSVFANSATNGPWGSALVEELLPYIDQKYGGAGPEYRYVTGASSGGWASLWLTVNYPKAFRACWAVAPDPVDFSSFQALNLRDDKADNLFTNEEGEPRLLSIKQLGMSYQKFAAYEKVLGPGGQLKSFAAVFSKRGKNGDPEPWYDETSGAIHQAVCDSWAPYDISRFMEKNWSTLKPHVQGKIRVIVHKQDLFLLNFAVKKLEKTCKRLGSDAIFSYLEGRGHHMPFSSSKRMAATITNQWQERSK